MILRYLSINQLSELTGKDRRTIKDRLVDLAPHSEDKRGCYYDTHEALPRLFEHSKTAGGLERKLLQEKLKFDQARTEKIEIEVGEMKRRLVPIEDIGEAVEKEYTSVRTRLRAIPSKLAKPLSMVTDPNQVQIQLQDAVDECLTELNVDAKYEQERLKTEIGSSADSSSSSFSETESGTVGGSIPVPESRVE